MKIEEKVAQNDLKYRNMAIDNVTGTVWVIDARTLTVLYVSPSTQKVRGFSSDETIGCNIKDIIAAESHETADKKIAIAIQDYNQKNNKSYQFEIEVYHKDGSTLWLELNTKFIREEDGNLKIVGISKDITIQRKAEHEREKLIAKLNKVIAEKNRLVEELKMFETLLPICSACRRIRHNDNTWWPIEKYIEDKAGSQFSHTICPDCTKIYYDK